MSEKKMYLGKPEVMLEEFVDKFIDYSREEPLDTFLILPTARMVRNVQIKLQRRNIPYVKTNVSTLFDMAKLFFDNVNRDLILLDDDQRAIIIDHLIDQNRDSIPLLSRGNSSISYNLATFFSLLKGYREDYPDCMNVISEKIKELSYLKRQYESYLDKNSYIDRETLIEMVSGYDSISGNILIYGLYDPLPIETELLRSLKERSRNFHCFVPYSRNERLFKDDWNWIGDIDRTDLDLDLDIFNGSNEKDPGKEIFIGRMVDRPCEVRNVASKIRSMLETDPDSRIAVVLPEPDRGHRMVKEVFSDFGIPHYISRGISLSESPLIQDLVGIIRSVSSGYMREHIVNLVKSPYMDFKSKGRTITGNLLDNISVSANVIGGINGWMESLENRSTALKDEILNPDISDGLKKRNEFEIKEIDAVKEFLQELFSVLKILSHSANVKDHVRNFRRVMEKMNFIFDADRSTSHEAAALKNFFQILESMERNSALVPSSSIDLFRFLSLLSERVARSAYKPGPTNYSTVQIVGMRELAGCEFDHVFIVDMVEGDIPRVKLAHSYLNEKEILKMKFLKKEELLRQERYYFWTNINSARKSVYLSCSETDDNNPLVPSLFFQQMMDEYKHEKWGDNSIKGFVLKKQIEDGEMIASGKLSGISSATIENLVKRINSENFYREFDDYSIYDGIIEGDLKDRIAEDFSTEKPFSPSSLEAYADCPFKFLLKYVLYLDKMEEVEETVTPLEKGNMIHHILFRFYNGIINKKVTDSNFEDAFEQIVKIANDEMDRFHFRGPSWEYYRNSLVKKEGLLHTFLKRECEFEPAGFNPAFFELSMGTKIDPKNRDKNSVADPVEIDLGGQTLKLKGKIDRVDINDEKEFIVIDYKTGDLAAKKSISEGLSLQLPLYLKALERIQPGYKGVGGGYFQIKNRNKCCFQMYLGPKKLEEDIDRCFEKVREYLDAIRDGQFNISSDPKKKCNKYCPGKRICRYLQARTIGMGGI